MTKLTRIQTISRALRWVFTGLMLINPLLLLITWWQFPELSFISSSVLAPMMMGSIDIIPPVPSETIVIGFLLSTIPLMLLLMMFWYLIKLFKVYEAGSFFNYESTLYLKRAAQFLFLKELINPFYSAAMTANLTWHHPFGQRLMSIGFDASNFYSLLLATVLLLLSWIMAQAYALSEENRLTV